MLEAMSDDRLRDRNFDCVIPVPLHPARSRERGFNQAEVLAKMALLAGPSGAGRILARHGGLVVRDDGDIELFGCLRPRIVVRFPARAVAA